MADLVRYIRNGNLYMEAAVSPVEPDRRNRSRRFSAPVFAGQPGGNRKGRRVFVLCNRDFSRFSGKYDAIAHICAHVRRRGSDPIGSEAVWTPIQDTVYALRIGCGCADDVQIKKSMKRKNKKIENIIENKNRKGIFYS